MSIYREIDFKDIRVGDVIEVARTYRFKSGQESSIHRGTVVQKSDRSVYTGRFFFPAAPAPTDIKTTFHLVERNLPPEPQGRFAVVKAGGVHYVNTGRDDEEGEVWEHGESGWWHSWSTVCQEGEVTVLFEGVDA